MGAGPPLVKDERPCTSHQSEDFEGGRCTICGHTACSECGGHGRDYKTEAEYRGDAPPAGTCSLCNGRGVAA